MAHYIFDPVGRCGYRGLTNEQIVHASRYVDVVGHALVDCANKFLKNYPTHMPDVSDIGIVGGVENAFRDKTLQSDPVRSRTTFSMNKVASVDDELLNPDDRRFDIDVAYAYMMKLGARKAFDACAFQNRYNLGKAYETAKERSNDRKTYYASLRHAPEDYTTTVALVIPEAASNHELALAYDRAALWPTLDVQRIMIDRTLHDFDIEDDDDVVIDVRPYDDIDWDRDVVCELRLPTDIDVLCCAFDVTENDLKPLEDPVWRFMPTMCPLLVEDDE